MLCFNFESPLVQNFFGNYEIKLAADNRRITIRLRHQINDAIVGAADLNNNAKLLQSLQVQALNFLWKVNFRIYSAIFKLQEEAIEVVIENGALILDSPIKDNAYFFLRHLIELPELISQLLFANSILNGEGSEFGEFDQDDAINLILHFSWEQIHHSIQKISPQVDEKQREIILDSAILVLQHKLHSEIATGRLQPDNIDQIENLSILLRQDLIEFYNLPAKKIDRDLQRKRGRIIADIYRLVKNKFLMNLFLIGLLILVISGIMILILDISNPIILLPILLGFSFAMPMIIYLFSDAVRFLGLSVQYLGGELHKVQIRNAAQLKVQENIGWERSANSIVLIAYKNSANRMLSRVAEQLDRLNIKLEFEQKFFVLNKSTAVKKLYFIRQIRNDLTRYLPEDVSSCIASFIPDCFYFLSSIARFSFIQHQKTDPLKYPQILAFYRIAKTKRPANHDAKSMIKRSPSSMRLGAS